MAILPPCLRESSTEFRDSDLRRHILLKRSITREDVADAVEAADGDVEGVVEREVLDADAPRRVDVGSAAISLAPSPESRMRSATIAQWFETV